MVIASTAVFHIVEVHLLLSGSVVHLTAVSLT